MCGINGATGCGMQAIRQDATPGKVPGSPTQGGDTPAKGGGATAGAAGSADTFSTITDVSKHLTSLVDALKSATGGASGGGKADVTQGSASVLQGFPGQQSGLGGANGSGVGQYEQVGQSGFPSQIGGAHGAAKVGKGVDLDALGNGTHLPRRMGLPDFSQAIGQHDNRFGNGKNARKVHHGKVEQSSSKVEADSGIAQTPAKVEQSTPLKVEQSTPVKVEQSTPVKVEQSEPKVLQLVITGRKDLSTKLSAFATAVDSERAQQIQDVETAAIDNNGVHMVGELESIAQRAFEEQSYGRILTVLDGIGDKLTDAQAFKVRDIVNEAHAAGGGIDPKKLQFLVDAFNTANTAQHTETSETVASSETSAVLMQGLANFVDFGEVQLSMAVDPAQSTKGSPLDPAAAAAKARTIVDVHDSMTILRPLSGELTTQDIARLEAAITTAGTNGGGGVFEVAASIVTAHGATVLPYRTDDAADLAKIRAATSPSALDLAMRNLFAKLA